MKKTLFAMFMFVGACGGDDESPEPEPLYRVTITCTAMCDGNTESRSATECTTLEDAQQAIDEAVDECATTLGDGSCASWDCNCSYPQDNPRCD